MIRFYNFNFIDVIEYDSYKTKKLKIIKKARYFLYKRLLRTKKYKWFHGPIYGKKLGKLYLKNKNLLNIQKKKILINNINNYKKKKIFNLRYK